MERYLILLLCALQLTIASGERCNALFNTDSSGTKEYCDGLSRYEKYTNLLILTDAHCYLNSTKCKALAGRFEFYFDLIDKKVLGPVEASADVDENGYHRRVPVAYNINGSVVYADKSINWASLLVAKAPQISESNNLLDIRKFNWCAFADSDFWPYTSAVADRHYHIYFYNRQSCIHDVSKKRRQHYNTRFLHNSTLRMDLDLNPMIFEVVEPADGSLRMIKHQRQHWYEVGFKILDGMEQHNYFIVMDNDEKRPNLVENGSLLNKDSYRNFTSMCLSDHYTTRIDKNNQLVPIYCGLDEVEIVDYPRPAYLANHLVYEIALHSIPRYPPQSEQYFGVNVTSDPEWMRFASDGIIFTAATSIPDFTNENRVHVILLFAEYLKSGPLDNWDENYPHSCIADYDATWDGDKWFYDRTETVHWDKNLNAVDDMAYLPSSDTVLIIFGPLYQEFPPTKVDLDYSSPIHSIIDLDIFEPVNAFFAHPDPEEAILFVYHRLNWIELIKLDKGPQGQTTGKKTGTYLPRAGANTHPIFKRGLDTTSETNRIYSEELFFVDVGVYKGEIIPDAPDPRNYPLPDGPIALPDELPPSSPFIYIIVGIALLLVLGMCVACLLTMRRRRKRKMLVHNLSSMTGRTRRSGLGSGSEASYTGTVRTGLSGSASSKSGSAKTRRSFLSGRPSSRRTLASKQPSRRSLLTSTGGASSSATSTGAKSKGKTRRSSSFSRGSNQ